MSWEPGYVKFGDGCFEFPRKSYDVQDLCKIQADYLLQHTEVRALLALFISHLGNKPLQGVNVQKEAGLFFTRPANVLQREALLELDRIGMLGPKPSILNLYHVAPPSYRKRNYHESCICPSTHSSSLVSLYSGFVTESTSATTLPPEEEPVPQTPTLEEALQQLITRAMETGLNRLYEAREREVIYDEAHLSVMRAVQAVVEAKWNPVLDGIKIILDQILTDVRRITVQRRHIRKTIMDKVPIKTNRLKYGFKAFTSEELPPPTGEEIVKTFRARKGAYNRYPKDVFGVYINSPKDEALDRSVTANPFIDENEDGPMQVRTD